MQEMFGSVRRSLVFRTPDSGGGGDEGTVGTLVDKINSCIRKSIVFSKPSPQSLPPTTKDSAPPPPSIRWRKGELIGCGAFGQVYMGMNLDSGELLAVKQVLIANSASKEKAQAHIRELEEEVKLLKNLSHPNIVRYLGTVREEETLNILLEFVPGGSISSLLGKFGSFPEAVVRMYTKQLLWGLDYLHKNGIMHRDIKGANILVDNKGCIKLADFGASKQVVELATVTGAKSMKGTPYWMAPEVILQTGHRLLDRMSDVLEGTNCIHYVPCSADIWSVGCTVIEMATGKPPWSQQYQEVAALFHIGTTKAHPPIPEHLSAEAKDFLLKCLKKEPELRPPACELLQHPFVTGESMQCPAIVHASPMENYEIPLFSHGRNSENITDSMDVCNLGTLNFSTVNSEKLSESRYIGGANNSDDDMCQIDDEDDFMVGAEAERSSVLIPDEFSKIVNRPVGTCGSSGKDGDDFSFNGGRSLSEDDDEVTESKIRAFLDEKVILVVWLFN
ncbi:unnamed protein product [Ilex paraguariensis]|uniref:mitogen-activated protein kinase kinase kinase n=1 Tax=Ilex paraguariensis TaxID=185542 RepID=A0ABC8TF24_9AQUA